MKKLLALVLAVAMLISVVSLAAAEDKKTLTIVAWDATTTAYLTAQKEAYEASHPDVTIEYVDVPSQDWGTDMATKLNDDHYDIFMVKDVPSLQNWYNAGSILSLNDYISANNFDLSGYKGMDANYKIGEDQAALPFRSDFEVLFYNKDLFDAAGVEYPTNEMTWEQYKEKALALTNTDPANPIYGTHYHTWLSTAVNYTVADGENTLVDGNYDDLAYFYQIIQDLEDAEACILYTELKASGTHYSGAFGNGNIAMMPMGYWFVPTLAERIASGEYKVQNWGIASMPVKEGVTPGSTFGNLTGAAINKASKQPDVAWDYIAWLCGEEGSKVTAATGNRPAWVSEAIAEILAQMPGFPADEGSKAALLPTAVYIEMPATEHTSEISAILGEEHDAIMNRAETIEDGIANMNERVAEVLGK